MQLLRILGNEERDQTGDSVKGNGTQEKNPLEVNKPAKRRLTSPQSSCFVEYLPGKNQ
jgi:hypothetical protein